VETKRQLTRCNDELGFYQDVVTTNDSMIMDYDKLINEMNLKNTDCKQYNDALLGQLVKAQSDFKTEHVNKNIWKAVALSIPVVLAVLLIISQK
jgi:pyruvate-formate lyase-activating enzyme